MNKTVKKERFGKHVIYEEKDLPRNVIIPNITLIWSKLHKAVNPFAYKFDQYEQGFECGKEVADELLANNISLRRDKVTRELILNDNGLYTGTLKRYAQRHGSNGKPDIDNTPVDVVNMEGKPFTDMIGNGSIGDIMVYQMAYSNAMGKGVFNILTKIRVKEHVIYSDGNTLDFDYPNAPVVVNDTVVNNDIEF
jgi:hypothetical protein